MSASIMRASDDFRDWPYWNSNGGKCLVAVLGGFFDRSEQWPDLAAGRVRSVVSLCGVVFSKVGAEEFSRQWAQLNPDGFHMNELVSRVGGYEDWTQEDEDALLFSFHPLFAEHAELVYLAACDSEEAAKHRGPFAGSRCPFSFLCTQVLVGVSDWLMNQERGEQVDYTLDWGDPGEAEANEFFDNVQSVKAVAEALRVWDHRFKDRREVPLIEAADYLAYEFAHMHLRMLRPHMEDESAPVNPPRMSFISLHQTLEKAGKLRMALMECGRFEFARNVATAAAILPLLTPRGRRRRTQPDGG